MNRYFNKVVINNLINKFNKCIYNSKYFNLKNNYNFISISTINNNRYNNNLIINNNFKNKTYTTSTTSTKSTLSNKSYFDNNDGRIIYNDDNCKQIDFDIETMITLIELNEQQLRNGIIPDEISNNYKKIIECNPNEIQVLDRIMCAKFLSQIELFKNKNNGMKIDKFIVDKIWRLLDVEEYKFLDDENVAIYQYDILIEKLQLPLFTGYGLSNLFKLVLDAVKIIESYESNSSIYEGCAIDINRLTVSAYYASALLGMWKEMVFIREKMNQNLVDLTIYSIQERGVIDTESIYKILKKQIQHSILSTSISDQFYDITQDSLDAENPIYGFKYFESNLYGIKNFTFDNINMEEKEFTFKQKEFFLKRKIANKIQSHDENGFSLFGNDGTLFFFAGRTVKLMLPNGMVYSGITNKEFNKLHLYGRAVTPKGDKIESQYNFNIKSFNNNSISLNGVHRTVHETNDGKRVIIGNDAFSNLTLSNIYN